MFTGRLFRVGGNNEAPGGKDVWSRRGCFINLGLVSGRVCLVAGRVFVTKDRLIRPVASRTSLEEQHSSDSSTTVMLREL